MNRTSLLVVLLLGLSSSPVAFDRLPPEWTEAMEVYHGVGTPMEYGINSCGVVLIWTQ